MNRLRCFVFPVIKSGLKAAITDQCFWLQCVIKRHFPENVCVSLFQFNPVLFSPLNNF